MSQTSDKGRILFVPMCSQGHINFCVPIANRFLELYGDRNEIYFALNEDYTDKVKKMAPNAKFLTYTSPADKKFTGSGLVEMMQMFGEMWSEDLVSYVQKSTHVLKMNFGELKATHDTINQMIEEIKPDFIIFDQLFTIPLGRDKNIKWANLFSAAMNFVAYPTMPPPQSGLPTEHTPENVKKWEAFIDQAYRTEPFQGLKNEVSDFLKEKGLKGLDDQYFISEVSPFFNFYAYPKELDYFEEEGRQVPIGKWLRIETPVTKPFPLPFPVPEKLKNLPGKLIYFSFGSMAGAYKPLFKKMLDILEQLPHRFIVSKGLIGDEYEMKANMYGENYLNQFAVLQTIDMVISHGGNNTLTESFNFGKPLIICPLFGDQPDNAQRIHDKGLGRRCSVFAPPEELKKDLEDAIEYCSRDSVLLKMKKASERIQKDSGLDRVCEELMKTIKK